jgi:hypothetical protein
MSDPINPPPAADPKTAAPVSPKPAAVPQKASSSNKPSVYHRDEKTGELKKTVLGG